jgi:nucleoside-diphosphate-sugar epimerase
VDVSVTGATGLVGASLVQFHLRRGDSIRILSRNPHAAARLFPSARVFQGDLRVAQAIPADFVADADVLYHCAAQIYDERELQATNIAGTRTLARLAAGKVRRWVQVSSASVYGAVRSGEITETSLIQPDSSYGKTKAEAEAAVLAEAAAGGFGAVIVRPSNIFGPRMSSGSLFKLFAMIRRGWFCFVGPPGAVMNYIHVDNVASALALCAASDAAVGHVYNLSQRISIEQLAAIAADEIGARRPSLRMPEAPMRLVASVFERVPGSPLTHRNLDALTQRAHYSSERIARDLAYNAPVSLETGLRELVKSWLRQG